MEKEIDHVLPFLDVLINNAYHGSVITSTFRKKTFMGLLTNYLSFSPLSCKVGHIRTLIDKVFKIKDSVRRELRSRVSFKLTCAYCNTSTKSFPLPVFRQCIMGYALQKSEHQLSNLRHYHYLC